MHISAAFLDNDFPLSRVASQPSLVEIEDSIRFVVEIMFVKDWQQNVVEKGINDGL